MSITIDKEFESLIPPLTAEEFAQLEENCMKEHAFAERAERIEVVPQEVQPVNRTVECFSRDQEN